MTKSKQLTIVITGGHHNSALVVARGLAAMGHRVEWIGHRFAAVGDTNDSAEYTEVTSAGLPFHNLIAGKTSLRMSNLVNIPLGLMRAGKMIGDIKPDAVLSFGGYLGLSVSLAAFVKNIPVFLHEQTVIAGKANKLTARFAKRVYLTWETSLRYYPDFKCRVVGLPLREGFSRAKAQKLFGRPKPTVLVLCGKQGSHAINQIIFAHLPELMSRYNMIHQTGSSSATGDYERAMAEKAALPVDVSSYYDPRGYIGEDEIAGFMRNADVVVGRSGAHSTYELGILGKKAVLIPLLSTHGREQLQNAHILEKAGIATILPQSELSFPNLDREITNAIKRSEPKPIPLPTHASADLIQDLLQFLGSV